MMSSSEVQRISLATSKIVAPNGRIHVEELLHNGFDESAEDVEDGRSAREVPLDRTETTPLAKERTKPLEVNTETNGMTNGNTSSGNSPNRANETITSSIGDITVDSVRDHLNSTTTTLCSTTTEETVGMFCLLISPFIYCLGWFYNCIIHYSMSVTLSLQNFVFHLSPLRCRINIIYMIFVIKAFSVSGPFQINVIFSISLISFKLLLQEPLEAADFSNSSSQELSLNVKIFINNYEFFK